MRYCHIKPYKGIENVAPGNQKIRTGEYVGGTITLIQYRKNININNIKGDKE